MTREEARKKLAEDFNSAMEVNVPDSHYAHVYSAVHKFILIASEYINQIDEPKWHTGKPTEEGLYLIYNRNIFTGPHYFVYRMKESDFDTFDDNEVAWQKIEPFSANTEQTK